MFNLTIRMLPWTKWIDDPSARPFVRVQTIWSVKCHQAQRPAKSRYGKDDERHPKLHF